MKKTKENSLVRKNTEVSVPKTVSQRKKELKRIQPDGEDGTTLLSFEHSDFSLTIPIDVETIKKTAKAMGLNSRTILEIGGLKIGLDIL